MVKVGIVGGSGYAGAELLRWLCMHPSAEVVCVASRTYTNLTVSQVIPGFASVQSIKDLVFVEPEADNFVRAGCDVVFSATPAGVAMELAPQLLANGIRLIDLGTDFRFKSAEVFSQWYGINHTAQEVLAEAVYGLPEIHREKINGAKVVGNPGCYPTSVILALAPALKEKLIDPTRIVINSASGVSGAGSKPTSTNHFPERYENYQAYKVASHRHTPEIEQELTGLLDESGSEPVRVVFTPHLVPMIRGILSTIVAPLREGVTKKQLQQAYEDFYSSEFFIRVLPEGALPETKHVRGSNMCELAVVPDFRTGNAVILSAIDNLCKGAASQAVQNMNLMMGLDETEGLLMPPLVP